MTVASFDIEQLRADAARGGQGKSTALWSWFQNKDNNSLLHVVNSLASPDGVRSFLNHMFERFLRRFTFVGIDAISMCACVSIFRFCRSSSSAGKGV